jgi:DNA-nicking Smr family endonuclease
VSGGTGKKRPRDAKVKATDTEIWAHYTRSITPGIRGRSDRVKRDEHPPHPTREDFAALLDGKPLKRPRTGKSEASPALHQATSSPPAGHRLHPGATLKSDSAPKSAGATPSIDPHLLRRTKRGRGVDARIDLHGMRRDEAYHALQRFLDDCHHRNLKLVLVITGKGMNSKQAEDWWDMPERGVLKRMVPQWLSQPAFSRLVAGHSQAGRADGGSGALYVQIRSARRTPAVSARGDNRT